LPDGGLIVADYMGGRIIEFDAKGAIVHQLKNLPWMMTAVGVLPDTTPSSTASTPAR
jgi:hypothetical protein